MAKQGEAATCPRHDGQAVTAKCNQCGTDICRECIREFGYFCSHECLIASRKTLSGADRARTGQAMAEFRKRMRLVRAIGAVVLGLVLLGVGWIVWHFFLDPAGTMAWQWHYDDKFRYLEIVAANAQKIIVRTGDGLQLLNTATGRPLGSLTIPEFEDKTRKVKVAEEVSKIELLDDGYLIIGQHSLRRLDADAKMKFELPLPKGELKYSWDKSAAAAIVLTYPKATKAPDEAAKPAGDEDDGEDEELGDFGKARHSIVCLDLKQGKETVNFALPEGMYAADLCVTPKCFVAVFSQKGKEKEAKEQLRLAGFNNQTSDRVWRLPLEERPSWGPVAWHDRILYAVQNRIHALTEDGKPAWGGSLAEGIELPKLEPRKGGGGGGDDDEGGGEDEGPRSFEFFFKEGMLFAQADELTICFDLASGKPLWRTALSFDADSMVVGKRYLFIMGTKTENAPAINFSAIPGANQVPDLAKDFGSAAKNRPKEIPVLVCMDRQSGDARWQEEHVHGQIFGDDQRLVRVQGSGHSIISMDKNDTYLFQYSVRGGGQMYARRHEQLSIESPILAGNRLLAVTMEIRDAGLRSAEERMDYDKVAQLEANGAVRNWRVIAFRLK